MNSVISTNIIVTPEECKGGEADSSASAPTDPDVESSDRGSESCSDETSQDISEKSSSAQKYEEEWKQLYCANDPELGELKRKAQLGNLRASRFRSVCWCFLLGVFPPDSSEWLSLVRQHRQHYAQLLRQVCVDPWDQCGSQDDDPLSQKAESIWHQHFCDKELRSVIRQDVVRTFPGVDFFRKESIQESMVNILFCYARENPAMCYRQGMHEILAPLLFVLHCDHQALLHTKEQLCVSEVISEMLDPAYMEEDAYMLFAAIMGGIESCYRINDLTPTCTGYFPTNNKSPDAGERPSENEVVCQLNWIRDNLLAPSDPQLHQHLLQLDIPLPLFGIRWLRLLFGREFPLQDLLVLWDAIFAEGRQFELVKFVVVAMLIAIRYQLLDGDYTTCLTYLMHYPGAVDISYIIEHALYLKDPQKHCAPAMTTFPNLPVVTVGGRPDLNRAALQDLGNRKRKERSEQQVSKLTERMRFLSTHSRKVKAANVTVTGSNVEPTVIDGYTVNDPALLKDELEHMKVVITLCRIKLAQYYNVLRKGVPSAAPSDVHQAIGGINELCELLGGQTHQTEVERACEAGEQRGQGQRPVRLPLIDKPSSTPPSGPPPRGDVALKLFSQEERQGHIVQGAPMSNPTLGW